MKQVGSLKHFFTAFLRKRNVLTLHCLNRRELQRAENTTIGCFFFKQDKDIFTEIQSLDICSIKNILWYLIVLTHQANKGRGPHIQWVNYYVSFKCLRINDCPSVYQFNSEMGFALKCQCFYLKRRHVHTLLPTISPLILLNELSGPPLT